MCRYIADGRYFTLIWLQVATEFDISFLAVLTGLLQLGHEYLWCKIPVCRILVLKPCRQSKTLDCLRQLVA